MKLPISDDVEFNKFLKENFNKTNKSWLDEVIMSAHKEHILTRFNVLMKKNSYRPKHTYHVQKKRK